MIHSRLWVFFHTFTPVLFLVCFFLKRIERFINLDKQTLPNPDTYLLTNDRISFVLSSTFWCNSSNHHSTAEPWSAMIMV